MTPVIPGEPRALSSPSRLLVVLATVVFTAVVAVAYVLTAPEEERAEPSREGAGVAAAGVLLAPPPEWQRTRVPPAFARARLQEVVALEPEPGPTGVTPGDAGMLVGRHPLTGASLLTAGMHDLLGGGGSAPDGTLVRLGALQARRYTARGPAAGFAGLVVYALPTTEGVVELVCYARTPAVRSYLPRCEGIARTVRVTEGSPLPSGPTPGYAATLRAELDRLNRRRRQGAGALRRARTPSRQEAAATRLAKVHRAVARRLAVVGAPPNARAAHLEIMRSLAGIAGAYAALARAIDAQDRSAYATASARLRRAERTATAALTRLRGLGYTSTA